MSYWTIFLSFVIFSVIGWIFESAICSPIGRHQLENRGFLIGPWCPIYGFGVIGCYLLFGRLRSMLLLIVLSAVFCCALEFATSYVMEKWLNRRWWDYSGMPWNLNGRICLYGAVLFGVASAVVCRYVMPYFLHVYAETGQKEIRYLSSIYAILLIADGCVSVVRACNRRATFATTSAER